MDQKKYIGLESWTSTKQASRWRSETVAENL